MPSSYDTSPANDGASVTPSDSANLGTVARALYVGVTGNIKVTTNGGTDLTFTAVPVGFFPVKCRRVWSTGTTATSIIALF